MAVTDAQLAQSPNNNKTIASVAGGFAGAGIGTGIVALLNLKYPNLPNVAASAIGSSLAVVLGGIGAWFTPILTAAQHRAIRALDSSDRVVSVETTVSVSKGAGAPADSSTTVTQTK